MSKYLFSNYQGIYFEGEFEDENAALRAFRDHRSVPKWDPVQNCQTYMFPENAGCMHHILYMRMMILK